MKTTFIVSFRMEVIVFYFEYARIEVGYCANANVVCCCLHEIVAMDETNLVNFVTIFS